MNNNPTIHIAGDINKSRILERIKNIGPLGLFIKAKVK
jgi:hypothetical protein